MKNDPGKKDKKQAKAEEDAATSAAAQRDRTEGVEEVKGKAKPTGKEAGASPGEEAKEVEE